LKKSVMILLTTDKSKPRPFNSILLLNFNIHSGCPSTFLIEVIIKMFRKAICSNLTNRQSILKRFNLRFQKAWKQKTRNKTFRWCHINIRTRFRSLVHWPQKITLIQFTSKKELKTSN
jgi:hypothetical protein